MNQNSPAPTLTRGVLPTDAVRLWPTQGGHLIQEVAREERLGHSPFWRAGSKAIPDDRFVPEEGVLCPSLPRVTRLLLPPSPPECLHHPDRAIAGDRPPSSSRHARSLGRWNDHVRATCTRSIVEGDRVVGRVPRDAREGAFDCLAQRESRRRVVGIPFGEGLGDDDSRSVDTHRELLPASLAASAMVHGGPFPFAHNREARAVDDEMQAFVGRNSTKREVEVLAAPGERRVIGRGAVDTHHSKERVQAALGLAQRQVADETERERGFDREGGVLELPSTRADAARRPGVAGLRCQPQGAVAPADEGAIVGGPVRNAVLRLVRWMDSRLHPLSVVVGSIPSSRSSGSRSSNLSGREGFMHQRR